MIAPMMRPDLEVVADLVPDGSRVLDLGCGAGDLLSHLAMRGCRGIGVDSDEQAVLSAIRSGVSVIELDVDRELGEFGDDTYDVVVLSRTLQALHKPADVLDSVRFLMTMVTDVLPAAFCWRRWSVRSHSYHCAAAAVTRVAASALDPTAGLLFQFSVDSAHGESEAAKTPLVTASLATSLMSRPNRRSFALVMFASDVRSNL